MPTTTKINDFAQRIKGLSDYRSDDHSLRSETAGAFAALLEIVVEQRASTSAHLAPEWATLATHLESATGLPIGDRTPKHIGHVAKEAAYRADNLARMLIEVNGTVTTLRTEVADLRRQKSDIEVALAATMTAWHKDKAALEATAADLRTQLDAAQRAAINIQAQLDGVFASRDAATKRADLAEATLESVRAAVAKPAEDKEDTRPKVGDAVPWAEVEAGALYYREPHVYPFCMVVGDTFEVMTGTEDEDLEPVLRGEAGRPLSSLCTTAPGVLVARDLGTDPEAWRAAMREHMAKVGK